MMPDMPDPKHARPRGWVRLCRFVIVGAVILSPVFFIVMYLSVTDLVRPSFHDWAWAVPVATEGCFTLLYCLDLLLTWAGKPMGWLRLTPYPFAAASLWLNIYSAHGDLPGMVGHGVVTVAFFLPLIAGEAAVRRLAVSEDEAKLSLAMADARQHAIDLCRDAKGTWWRQRIPSLLRRQILSGRLPDEVRSDVTLKVGAGRTSGWEDTVRTWVFRELAITVTAQVASRKAVASITSEGATEPPSAPPAEQAPEAPAEPAPEAPSKARPRTPAKPRPRAMDDDALMEFVHPLFDGGDVPSVGAVVRVTGCGSPRAKRLRERGIAEAKPALTAVQ